MNVKDAFDLAEKLIAVATAAKQAGAETIDLDALAAEDDKARAVLQAAIDKKLAEG
jgi:hypothetical protein